MAPEKDSGPNPDTTPFGGKPVRRRRPSADGTWRICAETAVR